MTNLDSLDYFGPPS